VAVGVACYLVAGSGGGSSLSVEHFTGRPHVTARIRTHPWTNGFVFRNGALWLRTEAEDATFAVLYRIDPSEGRITKVIRSHGVFHRGRFKGLPRLPAWTNGGVPSEPARAAAYAGGSAWVATEGDPCCENANRIQVSRIAGPIHREVWTLHLRQGPSGSGFSPLALQLVNGSLWLVTTSEDETGVRLWRIDPRDGRLVRHTRVDAEAVTMAPIWRGREVWLATATGSVFGVRLP
jgi:hypothetical protein